VLTALRSGDADVSVGAERLGGQALTGAVGAMCARLDGLERVAVVAASTLETIVAVAAACVAGVCAVPLNPAAGEAELRHVLDDARPDLVLSPADVDLTARASLPDTAVDPESAALVVYTSGTTGPPKGALLSHRAVAATLDGLATAWGWNAGDVLVHALPMFHVHGLVLGALGPLRHGSRLVVTPRFAAVDGASVYFAVPTMWSRSAESDLGAMRGARLLVSGSAALPVPVFDRVRQHTGHALVERYGLTESLIVTAATLDDDRAPGRVGRPLTGAGLRIGDVDGSGMGEVQLTGRTLFSGYLNRADATAAAMTADGWLRSGDLGSYDETSGLRLFGRIATDLIKTGGFKVGAGEVEDVLLAHPAVSEVADTGEPDDDLGERIVAWVVASVPVTPAELTDHVARTLAPHKRPRDVRFRDELPRTPLGKVQKKRLA
jgi:fatty acid CoA ligase FadD36/malonyl-CoA/methylmalonyl-CoA synthetase